MSVTVNIWHGDVLAADGGFTSTASLTEYDFYEVMYQDGNFLLQEWRQDNNTQEWTAFGDPIPANTPAATPEGLESTLTYSASPAHTMTMESTTDGSGTMSGPVY